MKIWNIEPKSNIILKITVNGQFVDLPTIAVKQDSDGIICEAIRVNGKVVSLKGEGVTIELMYIRSDNSPIVWKGVACDYVTMDTKVYYKIMSDFEGAEKNRREAFRLYLGCKGVAQVGINKKALDVVVKDISDNGFAFIAGNINAESDEEHDGQDATPDATSQEASSSVGKPVRLVFTDDEIQFALMGIVVRVLKVDESNYLYGCRLSIMNNRLSKYITEKQRVQISKQKEETNPSSKKQEPIFAGVLKKDNTEKDRTDKPEKSRLSPDDPHKRAIDNVEKDERREVFKKKPEEKRGFNYE